MAKHFVSWFGVLAVLLSAASAQAQMSLQRYYLESVGFEFVTQSESAKRCVQWREIKDKSPVIQYDGAKPFVMLDLEARVEGNCPLKFADGQPLPFTEGQGAIKTFRFKVSPPSTAYFVSGPGFSDQLIFEVLTSKPKEVGFFKFFENSQTRFDVGYGKFSTSRATATVKSIGILPVMSGQITIPFPWYQKVHLGFSLSQSLLNVLPDDAVKLHFSEFAFDTRYLWQGFFSPAATLAIVAEVRGRNWYQLGDETNKPFVVRSSPGVGFGLDYDTWVGASKWGYNLSTRYGIRSTSDAKSSGEIRVGAGVNYKIAKKWAMGIGYRWTTLGVDFTNSVSQPDLGKLKEQSHLISFSLSLINNRTAKIAAAQTAGAKP